MALAGAALGCCDNVVMSTKVTEAAPDVVLLNDCGVIRLLTLNFVGVKI